SALSFNLFALMRLLLPETLSHHRVTTLRWKLYAMAAKVVRTGRQVFIKMTDKNHQRLKAVLERIRTLEYKTI
ncbi:MAG: transposase, partial [Thiotrichaceae bacterium]|nr:transposase [Thiotrichaceae bacterium]